MHINIFGSDVNSLALNYIAFMTEATASWHDIV